MGCTRVFLLVCIPSGALHTLATPATFHVSDIPVPHFRLCSYIYLFPAYIHGPVPMLCFFLLRNAFIMNLVAMNLLLFNAFTNRWFNNGTKCVSASVRTIPVICSSLNETWQNWISISDEDKVLLCGESSLTPAEVETCLTSMLNRSEQATINPESTDLNLDRYIYYQQHLVLMTYIPPILLVLGTFGNVLSFIILTRRPMRRVSTYLYLAVLSVMDTLVLQVGLLRIWIGILTGVDAKDLATWVCKSVTVLLYTVSDYSVWLILAVTVERYIAVCHPLKAHSLCDTSKAAKVIFSIGIVILAINFHFFFTVDIKTVKDKTRSHNLESNSSAGVGRMSCEATDGFEPLLEYWQWVDAFIYSFLPFVVLVVLNSCIIHQVMKAKATRGQLAAGSLHGNNPRPVVANKGPLPSNSSSSGTSAQEGSTKMTLMLLTISFAFLITTLPGNVVLILTTYWNSRVNEMSPEEKSELMAKGQLLRTITQLLMFTNHSMNFYLYCAAGQKFRQQLCKLIRKRQSKRSYHVPVFRNDTKALHFRNGVVGNSSSSLEGVASYNQANRKSTRYEPIATVIQ